MERAGALPTLALFYFLFLFPSARLPGAQTQIPAKYDGFEYPGRAGAGAGAGAVMVEAFFDPLCPDSRDSWPPLKRALQHYAPRVSLIVHPFPLPYHSNAFLACRALHIANKLNASTTYPLLELFFKHQEKYYNAPTYNMSRASIINDMAKLAVMAIGENSFSAFKSGFNDPGTDTAARISFKYGCSRDVSDTPSFFVNGFPLPDAGSAMDYNKWRSIIDPLMLKQ